MLRNKYKPHTHVCQTFCSQPFSNFERYPLMKKHLKHRYYRLHTQDWKLNFFPRALCVMGDNCTVGGGLWASSALLHPDQLLLPLAIWPERHGYRHPSLHLVSLAIAS